MKLCWAGIILFNPFRAPGWWWGPGGYLSHFPEKKSEAQRDEVTCPESHSKPLSGDPVPSLSESRT